MVFAQIGAAHMDDGLRGIGLAFMGPMNRRIVVLVVWYGSIVHVWDEFLNNGDIRFNVIVDIGGVPFPWMEAKSPLVGAGIISIDMDVVIGLGCKILFEPLTTFFVMAGWAIGDDSFCNGKTTMIIDVFHAPLLHVGDDMFDACLAFLDGRLFFVDERGLLAHVCIVIGGGCVGHGWVLSSEMRRDSEMDAGWRV